MQLLLSAGISAARIFVFADPGQFPTYKEALEPLGLQVVKGRKGICNQRNAIMEHFKPGDRIVEMDDDISCLLTTTGALRSDRSARTVPVPEENLEFIIDHIWEIADRERCKLWGIYPTPNTYMLSRTYTLGLAKSTGQMQGYYNPGGVCSRRHAPLPIALHHRHRVCHIRFDDLTATHSILGKGHGMHM